MMRGTLTLALLLAAAGPCVSQAPEEPTETDPNKLPAAAVEEGQQIPFRQVQMHVWISETNERGLRDIGACMTLIGAFCTPQRAPLV